MQEVEDIGGWDIVLKKEEYDALYAKQQAMMTDFVEVMLPDS